MNDASRVEIERELDQLSRRRARFLWPLVGATLGTYMVVLIVLAYWPSLVATKVLGSINLAYVLGVSQFVMTFAVAVLHARWAHRMVDPLASRIRGELEAGSSEPRAAPAAVDAERREAAPPRPGEPPSTRGAVR